MRAAIARNVPVTRALPPDLARRLEGLVISFLAEKQFVGCNGLAITDEIRATIAAQACLLLLGRPRAVRRTAIDPGLPRRVLGRGRSARRRRARRRSAAASSPAKPGTRTGSSCRGRTSKRPRAGPADGYNVVLHEFAHYLDAEGRGLAPRAADASRASPSSGRRGPSTPGTRTWLQNTKRSATPSIAASRRSSIPTPPRTRSSSSRSPARNSSNAPRNCATAHPRLYALLREFYGIDPAAWAVSAHRVSQRRCG